MNQIQYSKIIAGVVKRDFNNNKTAAGLAWGCSYTFVSLVIKNERPPSPQMLSHTGHERIQTPDKYLKPKVVGDGR